MPKCKDKNSKFFHIMKLTNILLLLLTLGVSSCDKDDSIVEPDKTEHIEYSFVKIEFLNSTQTEIREFSESMPKFEVLNKTSSTLTYNHNPLSGIFDISQFFGIDTMIINNIIDLPLVAVPVYIENDVFLGEKKWTISNDIEKKESNLIIGNIIHIEPYKKLSLKTTLFYRELKTNFKLTLMNETEHKEQIFEGKWTGRFPINAEIEAIFTDL